MDTFLYFAYDADMSMRQMQQKMLDAKIFLDDEMRYSAQLKDYQLGFSLATAHPQVGHASLTECQGANVEGVLYELPPTARKVLNKSWPDSLQKLQIPVYCAAKGGMVDALVVVASSSQHKPDLLPSKNHLYRLLAGESLLSKDYFHKLKSTPCLKVPVDEDGMPYPVK